MKRNLVLVICMVALAFLGTASAQVEVSPGVARVSLIHGDVSSQRGDTGDWAAAALNQPVVAGDSVSTGDRSRAEIQLDHANILRLGNNAEAKVATLTRTQVQVQVGRGLAYYSVFKEGEAEIEIDTPNVAIRPTSREGVYRVQVDTGETQVIVRKGSADISTPQGSTRLEKGQSAVVRGTADEAEYKLVSAPSKDDWDSWNNERDGVIRNAQSWGHTNRYYVGSEDLDAYGRWVDVPDYGLVWAPVVSAGWAPYRAGRWVWEPYWGWTWVSYEPWGWAPYHYGRWFHWNSSWYWWPGPVHHYYRPIWAPAYVSFFGFGSHWGVGFGFGSIGWLPIGPCDRFYPWWGHYRSHFNAVHVTNITNITNITNVKNYGGIAPLHRGDRFSNLRQASTDMRVREAISTVPTEQFGTGRSAAKPVSGEVFREGRMMTGNLPLVPTKDNLSATNRPASATTFHAGAKPERFFSQRQPAAPESFARQAAQVERAIGRDPKFRPERAQTGAQSSVRGGPESAVKSEQPLRGPAAAQHATPNGWRRFDRSEAAPSQPVRSAEQSPNPMRSYPSSSAATRSEAARQDQQTTSDRYGWHKFSEPGGQGERRNTGPSGQSRETRPAAPATTAPARSEPSPDRGAGWRHFEPQSQPVETPGRAVSPERPSERWTPASPSSESRGPGSSREYRAPAYRGEPAPSSRPPLNLRQPIVTPRSSGGPSGGHGGYSAPSHSGGKGSSGGGGGSQKGSSGGGPHGNRFR